ncbi:endonuclease III [Candidatus Roizmanbacteria bacterium RIFCSPLOWO2_01_FULL_38_12]|uniref:Endonuclease III n=1 Tax=Candidatus Roizmanbacteria bacterium RIFCSPLOWO2_01_FULL_38_12 TaxID=1802061 RepID=A0A1F7IYS2_9BACT|nr:MAG: endonuclease III [Candidatus Roizmanbacteria bacterium RIFCSPHIGHO2_01_FULL_38_15]OGK34577.1 MAG: endonuclease III [Candidatus Roizmanbacteria bacterium RIFCSPHIGHO2_12_FULL_38_13]OGK48475.1 MAG: endonuclease III [Candidatus Roizmanbacteria bacterium RIFCSPLOWO2_01_FULL_38_12]
MKMKELKLRKSRGEVIIKKLKQLFPTTRSALNYANPWEFLVAVILSAQCTDKRVNIVTEKLFKKYKKVADYAKAKQAEFEQDVRSTGFYKNKTKNIITTAKIIHEKYHDKLPQTMAEMLTLPGVARKTANVVLSNAFGIIEGIAVDTHVRRLANLYGLTSEQDPDKIEKDLMAIMPKKEWPEFTLRMIDYGRAYCPAKKHDHENCPVRLALK